MSEIEKMYESAGIQSLPTCNSCNRLDEYWSNGTYCSTCKDDKDNDECGMANYIYPPFTAEKQIELIKWLGKRGLLNIIYSKDKNTYHLFNDRCIGAFCYDIATAIATLVQCELDFCSPEEKQRVKGILE